MNKEEKIKACRSKNIEYLTETHAVQINDKGDCMPEEICIGEFCHKVNDYNPICEICEMCEDENK